MKNAIVRWRSAITGRWVSKAYADANPDTTICETVKEKPPSMNVSY